MINIQMIGIDNSRASVEERELFSCTKTKQKEQTKKRIGT